MGKNYGKAKGSQKGKTILITATSAFDENLFNALHNKVVES